jgi:ATP synthase protein I
VLPYARQEDVLAEPNGERGSRKGPEHELGKDPEDARLKARLDELSEALDAHDEAQEAGRAASGLEAGSIGSAMSLGFRVLAEFVAAIVVGALIGWQIDAWTGTAPLFLLIFLLLGTTTGFVNVYRIATKPTGGGSGPK